VHGYLILQGRAAVLCFLAVYVLFFFRLGCRGGRPSLCMVDRCVSLHDWLALPLHGCAVSAWLLRSARSSC